MALLLLFTVQSRAHASVLQQDKQATIAIVAAQTDPRRPVPPDSAWGQLRPNSVTNEEAAPAESPDDLIVTEPPLANTPTIEAQPATITPTQVPITATEPITFTHTPTYHIVAPGDTLYKIAVAHGSTLEELIEVNGINNYDLLYVGQLIIIPGSDGTLPDPAQIPVISPTGTLTQPILIPRGTITDRLTIAARQTMTGSPYHNTTWLTYYGRPGVPIMGILGEHDLEDLTPLLQEESNAYDRANGKTLGIMPAYHLVYGMATKAPGDDGSHLAFLEDATVMEYIEAAQAENYSVILDIQIGALDPVASISNGLAYLHYENVHLAIDPEFAMSHANQVWPGNPIGFVTAEQINAVQAAMQQYMQENDILGPRILLVHQFQYTMIENPEEIDYAYEEIELTLSVDGWGGPWGKISKYNSFIDETIKFAAFKLFYQWDEPMLTPYEALGVRLYRGSDFAIETTPNLIIYQ